MPFPFPELHNLKWSLKIRRDFTPVEKELFLAGDLRLKKEEELDTPW